jgi:negative regulator of flagellin synthesis FlgM
MMKIQGTTLVHGAHPITGSHRVAGTSASAPVSSLSEVDQLDISPAGELASQSLDAARRDQRVSEIRAAIEAGTYETDEKLSIALDRLLDELG